MCKDWRGDPPGLSQSLSLCRHPICKSVHCMRQWLPLSFLLSGRYMWFHERVDVDPRIPVEHSFGWTTSWGGRREEEGGGRRKEEEGGGRRRREEEEEEKRRKEEKRREEKRRRKGKKRHWFTSTTAELHHKLNKGCSSTHVCRRRSGHSKLPSTEDLTLRDSFMVTGIASWAYVIKHHV